MRYARNFPGSLEPWGRVTLPRRLPGHPCPPGARSLGLPDQFAAWAAETMLTSARTSRTEFREFRLRHDRGTLLSADLSPRTHPIPLQTRPQQLGRCSPHRFESCVQIQRAPATSTSRLRHLLAACSSNSRFRRWTVPTPRPISLAVLTMPVPLASSVRAASKLFLLGTRTAELTADNTSLFANELAIASEGILDGLHARAHPGT